MNDRETYVQAKSRVETVSAAIRALAEVRSRMLDLVVAGELTSADFAAINALEEQLDKLHSELSTAPVLRQPAFTFEALLASMEVQK